MKEETISLPAASLAKGRHFAAEDYLSTASENAYLSQEFLIPSHIPKSPT